MEEEEGSLDPEDGRTDCDLGAERPLPAVPGRDGARLTQCPPGPPAGLSPARALPARGSRVSPARWEPRPQVWVPREPSCPWARPPRAAPWPLRARPGASLPFRVLRSGCGRLCGRPRARAGARGAGVRGSGAAAG